MSSQTLERGLDCLLAIADSDSALTIDEIAQATGLPASSVYRLIRPLEERGLIQRGALGKRVLGLRSLALSGRGSNIFGHDLVDAALPVMQEIGRQTQETVILTTLMGADTICIEAIPSPQPFRVSPQRGKLQTTCSGCSAKVLLAFAPKDVQEKVIAASIGYRRLNGQVVTPELLCDEIEAIRAQGYVASIEEVDTGAAGVSAPIFARDGRLLAGLTVTGPKDRFAEDHQEAYTHIVIAAARRISERCGLMKA